MTIFRVVTTLVGLAAFLLLTVSAVWKGHVVRSRPCTLQAVGTGLLFFCVILLTRLIFAGRDGSIFVDSPLAHMVFLVQNLAIFLGGLLFIWGYVSEATSIKREEAKQ